MRQEEGAPRLAAVEPQQPKTRTTQNSSTTSTRAHCLAAPTPGHARRWDRRHHIDGSEVVVWCAFTLLCTAIILALCASTWLVAS